MASLVVAQLLFLEAENPKKEVSMYINSPGGIVTSGMAIYDTMQFIRPPFDAMHRAGGLDGSLLLAAGARIYALRSPMLASWCISLPAGSKARRPISCSTPRRS